MMMAGLDGIANKINPGSPHDKDLYDLPPEEEKAIPTVSFSLQQSLEALDKDRAFLTAGGVLSELHDRCLHRAQGAGDHDVLDDAAPGRVRDVLQPLTAERVRPVLSNPKRGGVLRIPPAGWLEETA